MFNFLKSIDYAVWISIIGGLKWLYEYSKSNIWAKNRYLAERIDIFYAKDSVKTVQRLLDWNASDLIINDKSVTVDDEILYEALLTQNKKTAFNETEFAIRNAFDEFLDGLNELALLSECGLVDEKNLRKLIGYWLDILQGNRSNKPDKLIKQFREYMLYYGYDTIYGLIY